MKRYLILIVILAICEISLALYITFWREMFWDYVSTKNFHGFCIQIGVFTIVSILYCVTVSYAGYFTTLCAIKWRKHINLLSCNIKIDAENLNQRIQEDSREYPDLYLNLILGLGKAVAYILVFSTSLVYNYNITYLLIIVSYSVVATAVSKYIAKPLLSLNYKYQQAEATYRNELTKSHFQKCVSIMLGLALNTKRLSYFQTFYGQIAVILPIVIVAPAYFSSALTLGALMQVTGVMSTITDNLSFGITSFPQINRFLSCKKRLKEIGAL